MSGSVIVAGARTPMGRLLGSLKEFSGAQLGATAIKGALDRAGVRPDQVQYVIMGQVLTAGAGQIPARQAAVAAGIPMDVPALTVNKVCLSGIDAIALADQLIRAGEFDIVVAGGQESMTQAPHLLAKSRSGFKYGDVQLADHMAYDGLFCAFDQVAMGASTEKYNSRYEITRAILEEMARHHDYQIGIVTKSNLVLRDLDILKRVAENNRLYVNITVTTLKVDLARALEPRAPRPDLRMEAVSKLNRAGVAAGVICAPVLPGITDGVRDLESLVRATAAAGGKYIFANSLFLKPCSAAVFLPFLERKFPDLAESYRRCFKRQAFLPDAYRKGLSQLMDKLRRKYGIVNAYERYTERGPSLTERQQMSLF